MDRNQQEMKAPELSKTESILASEEPIVPSSGFLAAVMERVIEESAMPAPIPFPWKRAVPGFVLIAGVFAWGGNGPECANAHPRTFRGWSNLRF